MLIVILVLNWIIGISEVIVAWLAGSLSVKAGGFHSLLDGASNIVGLIAITIAAEDPDREHPYGHRKFEVLGALIIGALLAVASYTILDEAVQRLRTGEVPRPDWVTFAVVGGTMVINIFVTVYERARGLALGSEVLIADSIHTRADVGASMATLASLVFARHGMPLADIIVSIAIAGLIAWAAWQVASSGARVLSDRSVLDPEEVTRVAREVPGVQECHEVRTRGTQDAVFADLRIHVDGALPLRQAHELGHRVEDHLKQAFPGLRDVVIHLEPHDDAHP